MIKCLSADEAPPKEKHVSKKKNVCIYHQVISEQYSINCGLKVLNTYNIIIAYRIGSKDQAGKKIPTII